MKALKMKDYHNVDLMNKSITKRGHIVTKKESSKEDKMVNKESFVEKCPTSPDTPSVL